MLAPHCHGMAPPVLGLHFADVHAGFAGAVLHIDEVLTDEVTRFIFSISRYPVRAFMRPVLIQRAGLTVFDPKKNNSREGRPF